MCEKCWTLVNKHYPHLTEDDRCELLMSATSFPFGSPEYLESQLLKLKENTDGSLLGAMAFAESQLSPALEGQSE